LAFPILPGDRIDAAGDAWPIGETLSKPASNKAFGVIDGHSEAYILVAGEFMDAEMVAGKLRQAGIEVLRTGRYLGEAVDDLEADWFVRIGRPSGVASLTEILVPILGIPAVRPAGAATPDARTRLLTAELLAARAREAGLQAEIARLRSEVAGGDSEMERQIAILQDALEAEHRLRQAAEEAATAIENRPRPVPAGRVADEVRDVLACLLPSIRMLRDSVEVITAEFASRRVVWRALGELATAVGTPRDWKKIRGAEDWWERHLSNGRDNSGRIYARRSTDFAWDVLVSHKVEQLRDIAWLSRQ
jgi:hypothetical protein